MFGIITIIAITVVTLILSYFLVNTVQYVLKARSHLKQIMKLPGRDSPHPILGHVYDFPGPGEAGLQYLYNIMKERPSEPLGKIQYGPFIGAVGMIHPDAVKVVLRSSEPKPRGFGGYNFLFPWLGDGLLIAGGKKWARNRKLLTPAFHFDILKPYIGINNECADIFLKKMSKFGKTGEYFEVFQQVSLLTFDIILKCAFSHDIDCQNTGSNHPYVQAVAELAESAVYRILRPWLYPDWMYYLSPSGRRHRNNCAYVHKVAEEIIHKRRQAFKEHGDSIMRHHKYIDFLDILIKATDSDGIGLSDQEVRNEVDTFLFEGHDTTSSGICWTLFDLAEHPEMQAKCQKEVDALLEGRESEHLAWDDLGKLPYLTLCIKESLRHHSPVPVIQRYLTKEVTIQGHYIPANTLTEVNIYLLHHNPHVWDEPYEYRPERFTPDNMEKMDPYQYVPFSAGPRNCIGQNFAMHEMKVVIARILKRYTFEVDPEREVRHEIKGVMKTENGMYTKVIPRAS